MWTYAWDIIDLGFDRIIGELRDRAGMNSVSLATSYHAGRFLQPRSPVRKAYFPEDGTIYFHPDGDPVGKSVVMTRIDRGVLRVAQAGS